MSRLAVFIALLVVLIAVADARPFKGRPSRMRASRKDADVVGFVQGLVKSLSGSAPNINNCVPDFQKTISDAQNAVNTLQSGLNAGNVGEIGNGK